MQSAKSVYRPSPTNGENAMPFIPTTGGIRIAVEMTLDGQTVLNIYHAIKASPVVTVDLEAVAEIVGLWWEASLAPFLSTNLSLVGVTARDILTADGQEVLYNTGLPVSGEIMTAAASNQVAMVVTHYTLFSGRSSRGRSYIAGLAEVSIDQNTINSTAQAGIVAAHAQLREDLFAVPVNLAVVSFQEDNAPRTAGRARGIVSFAGNNRVDTQRRRLPGEGA